MFLGVFEAFIVTKINMNSLFEQKLSLSFIPKHLECGKSSNSLRLTKCAFVCFLYFLILFEKKKTLIPVLGEVSSVEATKLYDSFECLFE